MKRTRQIGTLALVLGLLGGTTASLAADQDKVDPSGTWKWSRTRGDRIFNSTLKLQLKDGKLAGTYKGRGDEVKIENAKLDGDTVSFQISRTRGDRKFTVKYKGKISGDTIKGEGNWSAGERSGKFDWQAKRAKADSSNHSAVLGAWQFKITTGNGNVLDPKLKITAKGDKLVGAYESRFGRRDAKNISFKDGVLSFEISGENDEGAKFKVVYKGKPTGGKIKGTIDYDFNGNTGTIDFVGEKKAEKKEKGKQ